MASKKVKGQLVGDLEAGDSMAALALRDIQEEEGVQALQLPVGEIMVVMTATFYYVGRLVADDYEYYALAPGALLVYETGPLKKFYGEGVCEYAEAINAKVWIRKGPTITLTSWPFGKMPKSSRES